MTNLSAYSTESLSIQILIVEDERVIARDIRACLENLGYSVLAIASSGREAIEKATDLHPDLILMDIRLKGEMDGIQAAEQIWNRYQIPIVYSTGYSDEYTLERAKATAPFGYILKPVEERELYVAIETAMQRYRLDTELKKREQWLSTILKGIGDGVVVVDAQAQIKFLNSSAELLLGYKQAEVQDHPLTEIFQIIDEQTSLPIENPVSIALQTGEITFLPEQTLLVNRNRSLIPIADSAAPLRSENGTITGVVLVFRDITQQRLAQERSAALARSQQLQEQMIELQRLNQLKDDFLSTVSHELRTPLTNIKMAIRMLEIALDRQGQQDTQESVDSSRLTRYLDILRNQCEQELYLVNDLLDMQKLNANSYEIDISRVQLSEWIAETLAGFQAQVQNRQLKLAVNLIDDLPVIHSDVMCLTRILTELLGNACKYTPPGEQISVTVQSLTAERIEISVCNSGVEITTAELLRIFEPFYRIPRSDRWRQGGTGLGLSLVKKLVALLEGRIRVESNANRTCFILDLPIQAATSKSDV